MKIFDIANFMILFWDT